MEIREALLQEGFSPVLLLDAAECGEEGTLVLAFRCYQAEKELPTQGAWVHPYYPASQAAYNAAMRVLKQAAEEGIALESRNDIRLKPLFARIPGMTRGRNTLSYLPEIGSRFHVQTFLLHEKLEPDVQLLPEPMPLHCGNCRKCILACPSGAIDDEGYHREKCIRNWMMSGQPVPEMIR